MALCTYQVLKNLSFDSKLLGMVVVGGVVGWGGGGWWLETDGHTEIMIP